MSEFRKQVRDHYDAQSLPAAKVGAILASGKEAAAETKNLPASWQRWARHLAIAAAVVLASLGGWWATRDAGQVSHAAVAPRVIEFFAGNPTLLPAVQDKSELRAWLVSQGAPADMEIPAKLRLLESAACQVVEVQGHAVYLSCYWREKKADRNASDLIHLVVARTVDFHDQPESTTPEVRELGGWSFASWTKGGTIYTLATATRMDELTPFLSRTEPMDWQARFIASIEPGFHRPILGAMPERR